jgi:beta-mannosidase
MPTFLRFLLLSFAFCLQCIDFDASSYAQSNAGFRVITLEEPTGIYRRDGEVVAVKLNLAPGEARRERLRMVAPDGMEIVSQVEVTENHPDGSIKSAELLFRAAIVPGERPEYRLIEEPPPEGGTTNSSITARRIGVGRFEMANERFGVIVNLGFENTEPALVAAFNKSAGEQRMLNLIDTSPDVEEPLAYGKRSAGFGTYLSGAELLGAKPRSGAFDRIEIVESGPLRARIKMSGAMLGDSRETWEFEILAGSPVLRWKTSVDKAESNSTGGFFFSSVSASPYLPFDRWMEGVELKFPDGWETDNPPDHKVGEPGSTRDFDDLPGRHIVYYQREENYGAIGFYELDRSLVWKGAGARQFYSSASLSGDKLWSEIAVAFPNWKGTETVMETRKEFRKFTQPILSVVSDRNPAAGGQRADYQLLPRNEATVRSRPAAELKLAALERSPEFSLDGDWKLNHAEKSEGEKLGFHRADFDDSSWRDVKVPGSVQTQILEAPKFHTRDAEWISEKEWWYRRGFTVPPAAIEKRLWLQFDATDYHADIYLNGELLGRHEGYIDPYKFDVTGRLKLDGENRLAVRVWTPVSYYWRHRPYTTKGSYGAVDQKPDNITPLGITRPVRLLATGDVTIDDLAVYTRINKDGSADVIVDVDLRTVDQREVGLTLELAPRNFDAQAGLELKSRLSVSPESSSRRFTLRVENPRLWWTWDHGKPNLYTLSVRVHAGDGSLADARSLAVGIREIEHIDWKFYLNGKRMFIRGTNSYYNLFLSEMRRSDYDRDLELMRRMNINMIRLHCHFSNPEFYDVADELGIMVWQDYLEAWYPEDRAFSIKAARLYDPLIKYARNHPSVAVWATSDEESLENYRDLTKHLEPRLYLHDPQRRPVVRSTGRYGDAHVYEGWYGGTIWNYAKMSEKFVSELGATALPNYDSIMKFLPNHWPIKDHEDEWVFRKLQVFEAMRAWGEPGNMTLQQYIPQTQDYVARLFQLAIERMRRLKYDPAGGILHFHAIDLWPSVTMAALDYYRQPTKAYHTVQRSFQMVLPSFAYDRDSWASGETVKSELWLINDHWRELPDVSISWRLEDGAGKVVLNGGPAVNTSIGADSARKLMDVSFRAGAPGKFTLWARIADRRGQTVSENNYEFVVK